MSGLSAPYQFAIRATKVGYRKFASRAAGSLRGVKGYRPLHPLGKLWCTKPFEIGFVQCFLGHRGHSGSVSENRIRKPLAMTERVPSSRIVDFIGYLLRDSSNVDVALTWNAEKQKAPRDARPKVLVLFGKFGCGSRI